MTKCHQCFRNLYRTSNIYIGRPIYISDIQYLYPTSDIPALALALALAFALAKVGYCISDVGYRYSDVGYRYPDVGYRYPDVGYRYRTSDIDIGRPIYILDVRYTFRKHWWHFVLNGASYRIAQNFYALRYDVAIACTFPCVIVLCICTII